MGEPTIESGLQLFARINESQHDILKYPPLLSSGVFPQECIEITGECGVGKTFVLLDFVVNSVLPKTHKNIDLTGNDVELVLINTDHHFNIGTVANLIEHKLRIHLKAHPPINLIQDCLKKITLLNCYNSEQLKFTFLNLEYILQENPQIRVVAIDSICSYYWMDRIDLGCVSFSHYWSTVKSALTNTINDFNIVTVYTQVEIPTQSQKSSKKDVDYCIRLKLLTQHTFEAKVMKGEEEVLPEMKYRCTPYVTFVS